MLYPHITVRRISNHEQLVSTFDPEGRIVQTISIMAERTIYGGAQFTVNGRTFSSFEDAVVYARSLLIEAKKSIKAQADADFELREEVIEELVASGIARHVAT